MQKERRSAMTSLYAASAQLCDSRIAVYLSLEFSVRASQLAIISAIGVSMQEQV